MSIHKVYGETENSTYQLTKKKMMLAECIIIVIKIRDDMYTCYLRRYDVRAIVIVSDVTSPAILTLNVRASSLALPGCIITQHS